MGRLSRKLTSVGLALVTFCICASASVAGLAPTVSDKDKQNKSTAGYLFLANREEIVAGAKKEGRLRVQSNLEPNVYPHLLGAFQKKYPFIEVRIDEVTGADTAQRFLLELKSGRVKELDTTHMSEEFYAEYLPFLKKITIKDMAEKGVLNIPLKMIDPDNPFVVASGTVASAVAYNKKLMDPSAVPNTWDDFLKPELKGRKFVADIRPQGFTALAAALGEEWVVDYARKLGEQKPIWTRGHTRALAAISSGEYTIHQMTNYHTCMRAAWKDPTRSLACKMVEPVPVRIALPDAILESAPHPNTALLWLEFLASPEAQKIVDEHEPLRSSIYSRDAEIEKATRGKKIAIHDFRTFKNSARWMNMTFEAFGLPKAEK